MTKEELKEHCEACFALGVIQGAIMVSVHDKQIEFYLSGYIDKVFDRLLLAGQTAPGAVGTVHP